MAQGGDAFAFAFGMTDSVTFGRTSNTGLRYPVSFGALPLVSSIECANWPNVLHENLAMFRSSPKVGVQATGVGAGVSVVLPRPPRVTACPYN